jgi:hypothetical protein
MNVVDFLFSFSHGPVKKFFLLFVRTQKGYFDLLLFLIGRQDLVPLFVDSGKIPMKFAGGHLCPRIILVFAVVVFVLVQSLPNIVIGVLSRSNQNPRPPLGFGRFARVFQQGLQFGHHFLNRNRNRMRKRG